MTIALGVYMGVNAKGPASAPLGPDHDALLREMMKASFRDQGIAKVERLQQDESDAASSKAQDQSQGQGQGQSLPDATAKAIEAAKRKTVKMPADGKFIGDWEEGEKLAQNGCDMAWTDPYNAKVYTACSGMPRFGHGNLLDEVQLKHLMVLLLDPKSPANP